MYAGMRFRKTQSAGYLTNHLARLFARGLTARIGPLGLSPGNFPALLELWETDGLTQKDLIARLDIEQATMANTLNRMERDGLIIRRKDQADARVQRIWLTEKARALHGPATEAASAVNAEILTGLSDEERVALVTLTRKAIAAHRGTG